MVLFVGDPLYDMLFWYLMRLGSAVDTSCVGLE